MAMLLVGCALNIVLKKWNLLLDQAWQSMYTDMSFSNSILIVIRSSSLGPQLSAVLVWLSCSCKIACNFLSFTWFLDFSRHMFFVLFSIMTPASCLSLIFFFLFFFFFWFVYCTASKKPCDHMWRYSWAISWSCRTFSNWREGISSVALLYSFSLGFLCLS